jgi:hypothetical protein
MNEKLLKKIILEELKKEITKEGIGDFLKNLFKGEPTINDVTRTFLFKNHRARKIFQALKELPSVSAGVQRYVDEDNYEDALKIALRADDKEMKEAGVSMDDWKYLREASTKIHVAVRKKELGSDYWG